MATIKKFVTLMMVTLVILYRYTLSPLLGPRCRFYPSCSSYAEQAIRQHGPGRGIFLACRRLLRCHPWHEGGIDNVPDTTKSSR